MKILETSVFSVHSIHRTDKNAGDGVDVSNYFVVIGYAEHESRQI